MEVLPHTKVEVEHVEHSKEKKLREFFKEVQPVPEATVYLLDVVSLSMSGIKTDQIFIIFQGGGSNGKTMILVLFISMLGEYCVTPDIKILTCKTGSAEGPDSKLMSCRGALVAVFQEPHGRDKLNSGKMKKYSGGDRIQARELYQPATQFVFQPLMIMCCNWSLGIDDPSEGMLRRPHYLQFKTRFLETTDPRYKAGVDNIKVVNPQVEKKFKDHAWGCQLLRMAMDNLKDMHRRYAERQALNSTCKFLFMPKYVKDATIDYIENKVPIKTFVEERLQYVRKKDREGNLMKPQYNLSKTNMWSEFLDWIKNEGESNDDIKDRSPSMLYTALETQYVSYYKDGPTNNSRKQAFWNYRLKSAGPSTRSPLASLSNNAI